VTTGHLRYRTVQGDFTAELSFSGAYRELYDQAGMMLRIDERNWLKAGIEFVDGRQMLSVVVTRDFSDWSTAPGPSGADWMGLRISATHPQSVSKGIARAAPAIQLDASRLLA
jgi:regulation of enolase protein 1 (concanavalin A-like superfamily)